MLGFESGYHRTFISMLERSDESVLADHPEPCRRAAALKIPATGSWGQGRAIAVRALAARAQPLRATRTLIERVSLRAAPGRGEPVL